MAKKRNKNFWSQLDWFTIFLYLILVTIGWLNIYAAVYNDEHQSIFDITQKYGRQLLFIFAGLIIIALIFIIDSNIYPLLSYIVYSVTILSLIGVLMFGDASHGARSWFDIGLFKIQPAEFAKFATALAVANFMSKQNFNIRKISNLLFIAGILLTPLVLILLQPDTGSAIVYIVFILVLYREGLSGIFLIFGVIIIILFILVILKINIIFIFISLIIIACVAYFVIRKKIKEILSVILIFISIFSFVYFVNILFQNHLNIPVLIVISLIINLLSRLSVAPTVISYLLIKPSEL